MCEEQFFPPKVLAQLSQSDSACPSMCTAVSVCADTDQPEVCKMDETLDRRTALLAESRDAIKASTLVFLFDRAMFRSVVSFACTR
jgi:hypothetical protein